MLIQHYSQQPSSGNSECMENDEMKKLQWLERVERHSTLRAGGSAMCCIADEPEGIVLCEVIHGKTSTHAVISPLESNTLTLLCFYERWASEKKREKGWNGKELVAQKAMLSLRCSFLLFSDLIRIIGLRNAVDRRRRTDRK